MSYVQGTKIPVVMEFTDSDTGLPKEPTDVQVWIYTPTALKTTPIVATTHLLYSTSAGVTKLDDPGHYGFILDTSAEAGNWKYEVEGMGAEAVVKTRTIRVTPRLAV